MSDLVFIAFDSEQKAEEVREKVLAMQKEYLIELGDAVVAVKDVNGRIKLNQLINTTATGAISGAFWGTLIGLIFLNPLLGMGIGAASGALGGKLTDVGINDDFIKQTRQKITPGTSALFLYTGRVVQDRVIDEFKKLPGNPELLQSNLSNEQEAKLREAFGEEAEEAQAQPAS